MNHRLDRTAFIFMKMVIVKRAIHQILFKTQVGIGIHMISRMAIIQVIFQFCFLIMAIAGWLFLQIGLYRKTLLGSPSLFIKTQMIIDHNLLETLGNELGVVSFNLIN